MSLNCVAFMPYTTVSFFLQSFANLMYVSMHTSSLCKKLAKNWQNIVACGKGQLYQDSRLLTWIYSANTLIIQPSGAILAHTLMHASKLHQNCAKNCVLMIFLKKLWTNCFLQKKNPKLNFQRIFLNNFSDCAKVGTGFRFHQSFIVCMDNGG